MLVIFLLVLSQWSIILTMCHVDYGTDLMVNITQSLGAWHDVSCIKFLHPKEHIDQHYVFETYKKLTTGLHKSAGVYSYDEYLYSFKNNLMKRSCFKPIKLIIHNEGTKERLSQLSQEIRMSDSLWLIFMNSSIPEFIENVKITFNLEMIFARIKSMELVEFEEVYRVDEDHPVRVNQLGRWTPEGGLELPKDHLYARRSNLEGKMLRVGSIENWPLSSFKFGFWDGYFPRIWKEVQKLTNSSTKPFKAKDNSTGSKKRNGTWNGLVGMALNNEIDIIVSEISINVERSSVLKFSRPVLLSKYQVFFSWTGKDLNWKAVLKPFSLKVWLAIVAWLMVGTVGISICHFISERHGLEKRGPNELKPIQSFFFVLQSLCQQGYPELPKSTASRILLLTSFLLSCVLVPSYSAAIISSLTHEAPRRPFNSIEEMLKDGSYKLVVLPNSGQYAYFEASRDKILLKALEKLVKTVPQELKIKSLTDVFERVLCKLNKFGFFTIEKIFQMKMEYSPLTCRMVPFSQYLSPVYQSLASVKSSPYIGLFDYHLQRMSDFGIVNRIQSSIRKNLAVSYQTEYHEVKADDVFQIFTLLIAGFCLTAGLLVIELLISKSKNFQQENALVFSEKRVSNARMKKRLRFDIYWD